jgi:two-component system KDP operon response regulator KdpE
MVAVQDVAPQQILIVEDDSDTAEVVATLLETAGYTTVSVESGSTALAEIQNSSPDLVLLDLNLPDLPGLDVLKQVREQSFLPMIILSGFNADRDKVVALEAGADDFMSKPFSPEELVARVGALLRRVRWTPMAEPRLAVRNLELDLARRKATLRGEKLELTPIEYGILTALMRRAGETVTHDELLRTVWGETYQGDFSVLRVNISRLRHKLHENPRHPTYVVTVPGQGYTMPLRKQ